MITTLPSRRLRLAASLAAAGAAGLVMAGSAAAITPPTVTAPGGPTKATQLTFKVGAAEPDGGYVVTGYTYELLKGGVVVGTGPTAPGDATVGAAGSGSYVLRVTATQEPLPILPVPDPPPPGTATGQSAAVLVDQDAPTIAVATTPAANGAGWQQSGTRDWTCTDPGGSGIAAPGCPADQVLPAGTHPAVSAQVTDNAGNVSASATARAVNVDDVAPPGVQPGSPSNGAVVAASPLFIWPETNDPLSGTAGYQVVARLGGTFRVIAETGNLKAVSAPSGVALPQLTDIEWYVRIIDNAGNVGGQGPTRRFRIDPSVPPGPVITSGPGAQTNDTTPSFAWSGTQPTYDWAILTAGSDAPVQQGSGATPRADSGVIPAGDYTFRVMQISAAGMRSQESTYAFTLDLAAPAGPAITGRPISPTKDITPSFSWNGELHATYDWKVIGKGGTAVQSGTIRSPQPPVPSGAVTLKPLTPGAYTFQITQADRAGNTSPPTADPFSIIGPSGLTAGRQLALPVRNPKKLRPKRGTVIPSRRPVLSWVQGPRATTVYNVQVFRVMKRGRGRPKVGKVLSAFPKSLQYRIPYSKTRPAACYVWRVWPYLGKRFSKKPLGISNFCIANRVTLRKVAQRKAAQRKAARARAAGGSTTTPAS